MNNNSTVPATLANSPGESSARLHGWQEESPAKYRLRAVHGNAADLKDAIDGGMAMFGMKRDASGKWVKDGEDA